MPNLTPVTLIAASGLLKGQGLSINGSLVTAIDRVSNQGISGAIRKILPTASASAKEQLEFAPSFLTGFFPNGVVIPNSFDKYNLAGEIQKSANSLISGGIPKFAVIFDQAKVFATTAFTAHGELSQAKVKNFDDFGFQFNNFQDMITGGVTSQFDPNTVLLLASEFQNLGSLFNTNDLSTISDPRSLCGNLIKQGLGKVGNLEEKLTNAGVDLNKLEDADVNVVNSVLSTIDEKHVEQIQLATGFKPYKTLCCLEEALQISYLFSPKIATRIGSLKNLSDKLTNIGGTFNNSLQIANFYGSVEVGNFPNLNKLKTPSPDKLLLDIIDKTKENHGSGVGPFNNPKITDILGTVAGVGYADDLTGAADIQQQLLSKDSDIIAFYNYIQSSNSPSADVLSTLITTINSKSSLQNILNIYNLKMVNSATRLTTEIANRKSAKIDTETIVGTDSDVNNFVDQLSSIATDNLDLGTSMQITRMATNDVYGEAIIGSLMETRNLSRLEAVNITVTNKMDAMAYAKQLRSVS
jgi:hypothetical protein